MLTVGSSRNLHPAMAPRSISVAVAAFSLVVGAPPPTCRDAREWPFDLETVWNVPIGSDAEYAAANIFPTLAPSLHIALARERYGE